jgi:acetyltransferase
LTNSGGPGVTAADAVEAHGLYLAQPGPETLAALRAQLTPEASLQNPVDMLAAASPQQYSDCLRILLADPGVHSVMVILPPPPMYTAGGIAKAIIPVIYTADKPVVVALMGERLIQEAVEHFRAARVPDYRFPERAAVALAILAQRAEYMQARVRDEQPAALSPPLSGMHPEIVRSILAEVPEGSPLSQDEAYRLLEAYGISTLMPELAHSPEGAVETAGRIGYPVVLKVASPDIPHKSDVGGVLLGLMDTEAVREGFSRVCENAMKAQPEAVIAGVYVQRMVSQGQEVIVGAVQDPQFGPLVMFGSGGVEVEGLKDVRFSLAPLTQTEAESMVENTWAGRKLKGYRHLPPADREAVIETLMRLAQLADDFPTIAEIEINPLRVLPEGMGVVAVDVRGQIASPN